MSVATHILLPGLPSRQKRFGGVFSKNSHKCKFSPVDGSLFTLPRRIMLIWFWPDIGT